MRVLILAFCLLFHGLAAAEEVRLTNGEWAPYLGARLPHQGVASRIVEEAFALQGVKVQWEFYPWTRSMHLAERGERAGTAVWLRSPERERQFFISDPVVESTYYFFHRKDHPLDWQRVSDLKDVRLGGALGYDYGAAFQQAERDGQIKVKRLSGEEQGLRMVLAGRLDAFPMDKVVAFALLNDKFTSADRARLSFHPLPVRSDSLHLMLSREVPGNAELIKRFNEGLTLLRDSGKVARYLMEVQEPLSLAP
ncbi:transporter substrate-binding domain-containing protein [Pseudomonas sp. JM0905a]|uniref:Transporter substrate-binding domain-containing protein n=1 Tax=Metapseudomonas resinovorans TaxID=53412 RepID=A0ABT4Y298_METRE|nr:MULTISPECIES: transporter substrate-binding domain-containing protein [Pseudomonas]MBD2839347.1 transporter substrate-binding domain-containing protein [Pseudomonas sp. JM0905a]MDA8482807.1 transporter substrate-binding domain-containing protein [Pseudomonas resinovorans]